MCLFQQLSNWLCGAAPICTPTRALLPASLPCPVPRRLMSRDIKEQACPVAGLQQREAPAGGGEAVPTPPASSLQAPSPRFQAPPTGFVLHVLMTVPPLSYWDPDWCPGSPRHLYHPSSISLYPASFVNSLLIKCDWNNSFKPSWKTSSARAICFLLGPWLLDMWFRLKKRKTFG